MSCHEPRTMDRVHLFVDVRHLRQIDGGIRPVDPTSVPNQASRLRADVPAESPQTPPTTIMRLMDVRLPSPATFMRSRSVPSPPTIAASVSDIPFHTPYYQDAPDFLVNMKGLFINAVKWSRDTNPIEILARAGLEFPDLSVSMRAAIITAALMVRSEENNFLNAKMKELESAHDAFMCEFDKWEPSNVNAPPDPSLNLEQFDNRP